MAKSGCTASLLNNSIVASNTSRWNGPDILDDYAVTPITLIGKNIIGDNSDSSIHAEAGFIGTSGSPVDPLLAAFGGYGGPTQTLPHCQALLP